MTRADDRRRRIVRIWTVEHRIAQQELALARRDAQHIETVVERIEVLARDNIVANGGTEGASLAAISEMAIRLEHARRSTVGPLDQALRHVSKRQSDCIQANVKVENANRFLEKTARQISTYADARENAARCFRPKITGDEL
jgi:hypothetical protein